MRRKYARAVDVNMCAASGVADVAADVGANVDAGSAPPYTPRPPGVTPGAVSNASVRGKLTGLSENPVGTLADAGIDKSLAHWSRAAVRVNCEQIDAAHRRDADRIDSARQSIDRCRLWLFTAQRGGRVGGVKLPQHRVGDDADDLYAMSARSCEAERLHQAALGVLIRQKPRRGESS